MATRYQPGSPYLPLGLSKGYMADMSGNVKVALFYSLNFFFDMY